MKSFAIQTAALSFLKFDARQFRNILTAQIFVRGIKVRIPHNATVDTTTHWGESLIAVFLMARLALLLGPMILLGCCYDLLTNTRYGRWNS